MGDCEVRHPERPGSSDGSSHHSRLSPTGDESSLDSNYDAPLDFSLKKSSTEISPAGGSGNSRPGIMRSPELGQTAVPPPRPPNGFSSPTIGSSKSAAAEPTTIKTEQKIGEPQTGSPGMVPGTTIPTTTAAVMPGFPNGLLPNMAAMGLMAGLPLMGLADPKQLMNQQQASPSQPTSTSSNGQNGQNGKNTRPFKAYPKDPLTLPLGYFGLPGQNPFPGMEAVQAQQAMQAGNEEMIKQYKDYRDFIMKQAELQKSKPKSPPDDPSSPAPPKPELVRPSSNVMVAAPTSTTPVPSPPTSSSPPTPPAHSPPSVSTTTPAPPSKSAGGRKRTLPEDLKDQAYWERRRKNNDAAKRSRDARRAKEDEIAIRAAFLEQENLKLRVEVTALKNETAKLRCMLYNS